MARESELLKFAVELARGAGAVTMKYFDRGVAVDLKSDASPVTIADREAEAFMRAEIERRFPGHGVIGEEHGATNPGAAFQWVLDPIDGTKSFVRGVPLFGVLVALEENGESRLGVIHHPALDLTVSAETGGGAWANGRQVRVAEARSVEETAILCSGYSTLCRERPEFFAECVRRFPLQRTWGDCYGYSLVAMGRAQAMIDPLMNHWDMAAIKPIIEEAGGLFTDLDGVATTHGANSFAAPPRLHAELLAMFRANPPS